MTTPRVTGRIPSSRRPTDSPSPRSVAESLPKKSLGTAAKESRGRESEENGFSTQRLLPRQRPEPGSGSQSANSSYVQGVRKEQAKEPTVTDRPGPSRQGESELLQEKHFQTLCQLIEDSEARLMGHLTATCVQSVKASQLISEQRADMELFMQGIEAKMVSLSAQSTALRKALVEFQDQTLRDQDTIHEKMDQLLSQGCSAAAAAAADEDVTDATPRSPRGRAATPPEEVAKDAASPVTLGKGPEEDDDDELDINMTEQVGPAGSRAHPPGWYNKLSEGIQHVDHTDMVQAYQAAMGWAHADDDDDKTSVQDRIVVLGRSTGFMMLSAFMVLLTAFVIGFETNLEVRTAVEIDLCKDGIGPAPTIRDMSAFKVVEWMFISWMVLELLINLYADYFDKPSERFVDLKWNIFDAVVLLCSVINLVLMNLNLSAMRLARIGRIVKFVKLVRLLKVMKVMKIFRFLHSVRRMVLSMAGSLNSLFWALFLLFVIMYILAIILVQGVEIHLATKNLDQTHPMYEVCRSGKPNPFTARNNTDWPPDVHDLPLFSVDPIEHTEAEQMDKLYGSIMTTMLTLFSAISGGSEWAVVADPVARISPFFVVLWVFFVSLMIFGVLNILTGIFVDAALSAAQNDRDSIIEQEVQEKESTVNTLRMLFHKVDADGSGYITGDEFTRLMEDEEIFSLLSHLGLKPSEANGLFKLLDDDHSGRVGIDEFVNGCVRLKGGAKAVDMVTLMFEHKKMMRVIRSIKWDVAAVERKLGIKPSKVQEGPTPLPSGAAGRGTPRDPREADLAREATGPTTNI